MFCPFRINLCCQYLLVSMLVNDGEYIGSWQGYKEMVGEAPSIIKGRAQSAFMGQVGYLGYGLIHSPFLRLNIAHMVFEVCLLLL